jgi:hypothetical protein
MANRDPPQLVTEAETRDEIVAAFRFCCRAKSEYRLLWLIWLNAKHERSATAKWYQDTVKEELFRLCEDYNYNDNVLVIDFLIDKLSSRIAGDRRDQGIDIYGHAAIGNNNLSLIVIGERFGLTPDDCQVAVLRVLSDCARESHNIDAALRLIQLRSLSKEEVRIFGFEPACEGSSVETLRIFARLADVKAADLIGRGLQEFLCRVVSLDVLIALTEDYATTAFEVCGGENKVFARACSAGRADIAFWLADRYELRAADVRRADGIRLARENGHAELAQTLENRYTIGPN